jgi:hypothetical protein
MKISYPAPRFIVLAPTCPGGYQCREHVALRPGAAGSAP